MSETRTINIDIKNNAPEAEQDLKNFNNELSNTASLSDNLGTALNGAASGFAVAQGAMALFGNENEALNESLLKVQAALAIQSGVKGLSDAYKDLAIGTRLAGAAQATFAFVTGAASTAMKVFRLALVGTGIGAIVIAVGALIANFDKIGPVVKKVMQIALIPMKTIVDGLVASYYALTDALGITSKAERDREKQAKQHAAAQKKRNTELMDAYNKEKQAIQDNIDATRRYQKAQENRYDKQIELLEAEGKDTRKLEKLKRQLAVDTAKQILQDRIKGLKEAQKTNNSFAKINAKILLAAAKNDLEESQFQELKFDKETNKLKLDNYRNYQKDRLDIARQIEDLENSLLKDGIDKELEINRDKFRRLREDAERNTKLTLDEREKLIDLYDKQELAQQKVIDQKYIDLEKEKNKKLDEERDRLNQERIDKEDALFLLQLEADDDQLGIEIANLQKAYEEKYKLAEDNAELLNDLYDKQLKDEEAIREKYRKEEEAKDKESREKERADALATQQAKIQFANDALGAIGELTNAFAGESEKSQRRAFKINKAVGIAQAVINTAGAISAAINPAVGGLGIPAGLPGAILAGATGAAQIATIAKTQFEGGGDVETPSDIGGGGEVQAPSFNVVGDSSLNQLAQLQQTPTQAFVVSGEVTSAQALDRNRVTNATL
jgi:hypothetical protein